MKTAWRQFIIAGSITVFLTGLTARADDVKMSVPSGNYQHQLGTAKLEDPSGTSHTKAEVAGKVVVAIFSAPNMSQGDKQQKWADLLATNPDTKVSSKVSLVLIEDMTQAGMFKGMARSSMKKDFAPGSRPFLILDETGDVFKRFGVAKGTTVVLIYDKNSKLRDVETNLDDEKTADHRIKVISAKLLEE
jgi:hypothetical protein